MHPLLPGSPAGSLGGSDPNGTVGFGAVRARAAFAEVLAFDE